MCFSKCHFDFPYAIVNLFKFGVHLFELTIDLDKLDCTCSSECSGIDVHSVILAVQFVTENCRFTLRRQVIENNFKKGLDICKVL